MKSGKTYTPRYAENLEYWQKLSGGKPEDSYVIYAGDIERKTKQATLLPWNKISVMLDKTGQGK